MGTFFEMSSIVKTSYAFCSWICLWRFFDKISEQECFFREQECFFFSKISKKKKKKKNIFFFFQNRFKKVITFPKRHADKFFGDFLYSENLLCILVLDLSLAFFWPNLGAGVLFSGAGVLFFFSKISKKKKKKKKKKFFFSKSF